MAKGKGDFRLYKYEMGQLKKLNNGNKGHDHDTLSEAEDYVDNIKDKLYKWVNQIVIVKYSDPYQSKILKVINL